MAKRFTDTDKWKKALLKSMPAAYKLLWLYICDECDHAGVWQVELDIAILRIGENVDKEEAIKIFGKKIVVIDEGNKWYIPSFIDFQYGELNPKINAHASVIRILKKFGLYEVKKEKIEETMNPSRRDQDKDMDKDKDKDKDIPPDLKTEVPEEFLHAGIVPDMLQDFKTYFPKYPVDNEKDFPALLWIAYAIGKSLGLKKADVITDKRETVRKRWGEIVAFIAADKWFSTKSISALKSQWQSLMQAYEKSEKPDKIQQSDGTNHREEKAKRILSQLG